MSEHRFLVEPGALAQGEGALLILRGAEHHHLARVLRLKTGDVVGLFDGAGAGCRGRLERIDRDETHVRLESADDRRVEPRLHVTLAQGIPRSPDRMDLLVQKTTEIGVSRIVPIVARRSVARPSGPSSRLERWRRIASDAARQSGRLLVPAIDEPVRWEDFVAEAAAVNEVRLMLSTEDPSVSPLAGRFPSGTGRCIIAIGPEGGWSAEELALAQAAGYRRVRLGPRILRTETAGIVAVTLALYEAGETP